MTFVFRGTVKLRVKKRYSVLFSGAKISKGLNTENRTAILPEVPDFVFNPTKYFLREFRFLYGSRCSISYFLNDIPGGNGENPVTGNGGGEWPVPPIYFHPSLCVNKIYSYRFNGAIIYAASAYGKIVSTSPDTYEFSDKPQTGFTTGRLMSLNHHVAIDSAGLADYDTGSDDGLTTCFCRYEKDDVITPTFEIQIRELNKSLTSSEVSSLINQLRTGKIDQNDAIVGDTLIVMRGFHPFPQFDKWGEYVTVVFPTAIAPF